MNQLDTAAYIDSLMKLDKNSIPDDGGKQYNRLIFTKSPYLLQHSENRVDWYPWGEEAFSVATRENRPIFVSIGYSTCHWCHVMAHESFEDLEIADILNHHFVCIKVDREERPDIDDFFMTVAQLLTGGGGWPLNVFMTPDKHPFFAMTYLPKRTSHGVRGLMELLTSIATLWRQQPDKIEHNCNAIMDNLAQIAEPTPQEQNDLDELQQEALQQITTIYDTEYGGFGTEPKFPLPMTINWLLQRGAKGDDEAEQMAFHTLDSIRHGGIWDHIGGGIHRYAVDHKWLIPHFEKMLYDQAMLSFVALGAFQLSRNERYLAMAQNIFGFVLCDMSSENGGFYSAYDADSEGEEGKFYLWIKDDIDLILGEDSELFCSIYDVTRYGNFQSSVILNQPITLYDYCKQHNLDLEKTEVLLEKCCVKLLETRNNRIWPLCDKKIITSWNGLMIGALAKGGVISGIQCYKERAAQAALFIIKNLKRDDGRLMRSYMDGVSHTPAFLEDYAFFMHGLIELYEATLNQEWLTEALKLADEIRTLFYDVAKGFFTKTGNDAEQMPIAASLEHDGVIPSPFSMAASCFVRLSHISERPELLDYAFELIDPAVHDTRRHPTAHFGILNVMELLESEPIIATFTGNIAQEKMGELLQELQGHYISNIIIRHIACEESTSTVSICANGTCYPPCTTTAKLEQTIKTITTQHANK